MSSGFILTEASASNHAGAVILGWITLGLNLNSIIISIHLMLTPDSSTFDVLFKLHIGVPHANIIKSICKKFFLLFSSLKLYFFIRCKIEITKVSKRAKRFGASNSDINCTACFGLHTVIQLVFIVNKQHQITKQPGPTAAIFNCSPSIQCQHLKFV